MSKIAAKKLINPAANASGSKKSKPTHPPTHEMVDAALKTLKERSGSSMFAIKKYIAANYEVDVQKLTPYIKKYLKDSVVSGKLLQTKGTGATGSFKLSASASAKANKEEPTKAKAKSVEKKTIIVAKQKDAPAGDKKSRKASVKGGNGKIVKELAAVASPKQNPVKKKVAKPKAVTVKKASAVRPKARKPNASKPKTCILWLPKGTTQAGVRRAYEECLLKQFI